MEDSNVMHSSGKTSRSGTLRTALLVAAGLLALGGGAIAWKMRAEGGAAGGGDPDREAMRAELARLTAAESAFVRSNGRYAATASELGTTVTSRIVVFASARDGYHIRMSRPGTATLCEVSAGRFAAAHAGWQLTCGTRVVSDRVIDGPAEPGWIDRARARIGGLLHEDCNAECRQQKLREGLKSPERKQLDQALEQL
jgi:hypothetical protein